jgi:uncharacterized protein
VAVLQVGDEARWPLEAVTETFAIVGKRGSGKTSVAVVMAEEMLAAGQRIVVIDPTGVWWGLGRDDAGHPTGHHVTVVGGDHGHEPLREEDADDLATRATTGVGALVIDTSAISRAAARRFTARFLEAVHRANRTPMHVFLDEADLVAPQRAQRDTAAVLTATDDLVRRGRVRGLGVTLITQRPAVLHKDVLTQVSTLVAMRLPAPQDAETIDRWVRQDSDDHARQQMLDALPTLPVGTGYVWSPGWLGAFGAVSFRPRTTLDTSATPTVTTRSNAHLPAPADEAVPATARPTEDIVAAASRPAESLTALETVTALIERLTVAVDGLTSRLDVVHQATSSGPADAAPRSTSVPPPAGTPRPEAAVPPHERATFERLGDDEQRILELVTLHGPARPTRLAVWAGRPDLAAVERAIRRLGSDGFVEIGARVVLTEAGRLVVGTRARPVPDGEDAVRWWSARLAPRDATVLGLATCGGPVRLDALAHEAGVGRAELATICARLTTLGLVQTDGDRVAATYRTVRRSYGAASAG